ncbi:MAG TPA: hypothetical protein VNA20_00835 [Frankiaceae bacterium]|nr:hypothetical protein [Frankiaceae bacterium]
MTPRLAAALAGLTFALAGCADPAAVAPRDDAAPSATPSAHSSADAVVLRVSYEGGLPPAPGTRQADLPFWSLYGDGRVVTRGPETAIFPGRALPNLRVAKVSPATAGRIAKEARAAGIDGQQRDYGMPPIMDATHTVFRLSDAQGTVETRVYALSDGPDDVDNDARRTLRAFLNRLTDLDGWLGEGTVTAEAPYEPATVAVYARPYRPHDGQERLDEQAVAWDGPDPAAGAETAAGRCTLVTGAALDKAMPEFRTAHTLTRWTYGGKDWGFQLRPLLPDERTCVDGLA